MIKPLLQKILVAYNGSKSSLRAVMYAIIMAKQYKCEVKVVYVVDVATIKQLTLSKFILRDEGDHFRKSLESDGERNLSYAQRLAVSKGIKIETEMRTGAVWSEVITAADEYKANLVLLGGTSGDGSIDSLHHDVITEQDSEIVGSAHCSVMVVREPYIEQMFKLA